MQTHIITYMHIYSHTSPQTEIIKEFWWLKFTTLVKYESRGGWKLVYLSTRLLISLDYLELKVRKELLMQSTIYILAIFDSSLISFSCTSRIITIT